MKFESLITNAIRIFEGKGLGKSSLFIKLLYIISKIFDVKIYGKLEGMKIRAKISPKRILHYDDRYNPEPHVRKVFCTLIKDRMTVVDAGAFIGYYTLLASKRVGNKGKVLAFEPDPTNFKILSENIRINNIKNVKLFNKALGAEFKKLYFNRYEHDYVSRTEVGKLCIDVVPLEAIEQNVDLIKIDVIGAELEVLKGMNSMLDKGKVKIICEVYPSEEKKLGYSVETLEKYLKEKNYRFYLIEQKGTLVPVSKLLHKRAHYLFIVR